MEPRSPRASRHRRRDGIHSAVVAVALGPTLALGIALAISSGCQRGEADAGARVAQAADSTASANSTAAADTSKAKVTDAKKNEKKGLLGFLNRKKKDDEKPKEEPVPVELAAVEVRDLPTYLSSTATLEPEKKAEILSKSSGQVVELKVEEGDWVREGQLLARLESDAQSVALEESAARAHKVAADLDRVKALHDRQLTNDKDLSDAQSS